MSNIQDKIKLLPTTREEIDWKNRVSIHLPSVKGEDSKTELLSKADVKQWIKDFKTLYNEDPKFKEEGMQIFVTNPAYLKVKDEYSTAKGNYIKDAGTTESKTSNKMKISEFKKQIRETILSNLQEKKKKDEEAPEETPTDTTTEPSPEETPGADFGVDPKIQTLQNALKAAYDAAKDMGDEKLTTQIGNTITYFTRTHVVSDKDQVAEALKNTIKESIRKVLKENYTTKEEKEAWLVDFRKRKIKLDEEMKKLGI